MDLERDINDLISRIIKREVRWLLHYNAQVVNNVDILRKGRVKVIIPELGFDTADKGMWCFPRQGNSLSVPLKDEWVEVYFNRGNPNNPRYLHYSTESMDAPSKYDGDPNTRVLFESPKTGESITYKDGDGSLALLDGTEHFILGDTAKTELQKNINALTQLQADFTSWTPVANDGGAALKTLLTNGFLNETLANLTNILSGVITGK